MDPNATLHELRELTQAINDDEASDDLPEKAMRMADLFEALDNWIRGGGYLPLTWGRKGGNFR